MKSIKDEASAKEANAKLKAATDKLKTAAGKIKEPTDDQKKQLAELPKKYKEEMERISKLGPNVAKECMEGTMSFGLGVTTVSMAGALKDALKDLKMP
jgi:hypothetical protein